MIKFLRHIRQDMIDKNRIAKYLLYAVGEIVLVVIGILLALQINTWNHNRIENERAQEYIEKLKTQLNHNIQTTDQTIEKVESWYNTTMSLLSIIGTNSNENIDDKIDSLVLANTHDYQLNLDMNTVIEGRENGDMALISSDSIRQYIYSITTLNERIKEREYIANEDLNTLFTPYLNNNYNYRNLVNKRYASQNIGISKTYQGNNYKMLTQQQFENYISSRLEYNIGMLIEYRDLRAVLNKTVQML